MLPVIGPIFCCRPPRNHLLNKPVILVHDSGGLVEFQVDLKSAIPASCSCCCSLVDGHGETRAEIISVTPVVIPDSIYSFGTGYVIRVRVPPRGIAVFDKAHIQFSYQLEGSTECIRHGIKGRVMWIVADAISEISTETESFSSRDSESSLAWSGEEVT